MLLLLHAVASIACSIIDYRCERMVEQGLLRETSQLRSQLHGTVAADAIGYRQTLNFLQQLQLLEQQSGRAEISLQSFHHYLSSFQSATRQYAKRQESWFRREPVFRFVPVQPPSFLPESMDVKSVEKPEQMFVTPETWNNIAEDLTRLSNMPVSVTR